LAAFDVPKKGQIARIQGKLMSETVASQDTASETVCDTAKTTVCDTAKTVVNTGAAGAATGGVKTVLRLEGLTLFAGMVVLYGAWEGSWWVFAILFLAPDLSFLAYLSGPKFGALIYNAAHSYLGPMTLMTAGFGFEEPLTLSVAMIWLAHIGFDRALGYGLKYTAGFGFTHLGRIGRKTKDLSS
jgi:hypothetical protein